MLIPYIIGPDDGRRTPAGLPLRLIPLVAEAETEDLVRLDVGIVAGRLRDAVVEAEVDVDHGREEAAEGHVERVFELGQDVPVGGVVVEA